MISHVIHLNWNFGPKGETANASGGLRYVTLMHHSHWLKHSRKAVYAMDVVSHESKWQYYLPITNEGVRARDICAGIIRKGGLSGLYVGFNATLSREVFIFANRQMIQLYFFTINCHKGKVMWISSLHSCPLHWFSILCTIFWSGGWLFQHFSVNANLYICTPVLMLLVHF